MQKQKITLLLSGSVKKGEADTRPPEYFWAEAQEAFLKAAFPDVQVEILNPNSISYPKYLAKERFQADRDMLLSSDCMIVDARKKKGLGIGAEMVMAHDARIPVLTLCPIGSDYRGLMTDEAGTEREWIHPFVAEFSTGIFDDLESLTRWIDEHIIRNV